MMSPQSPKGCRICGKLIYFQGIPGPKIKGRIFRTKNCHTCSKHCSLVSKYLYNTFKDKIRNNLLKEFVLNPKKMEELLNQTRKKLKLDSQSKPLQ